MKYKSFKRTNLKRNTRFKSKNIIITKHKRKKFYRKGKNNKKFYNKKIIKIIFIFYFLLLLYFIKRNSYINNITKGKRNFVFKDIIEIQTYDNFEKIKEKYYNSSLLKTYLDNTNILSYLYHKRIGKLKKNKNNIHICMSFNDRYVYQILVSITMALENCDKNHTFITYHILCNPDVKNTTLSILKSIIYKYSSNLEMIFYDMGNIFSHKNNERISQSTYYRLLTPIFINIDKIIYLDGDTIILKDLNEMYEIQFNDNYILGFLDVLSNGVDHLGIKSEKYINAGVILLNLDKIRTDNKIYDIINTINSNKYFPALDQTIINYVFYPKIGILPSKFGIWNFSDKKDIQIYLSCLRQKLDINELEESFFNPSIIHSVLCYPKIFSPSSRYITELTTCKERGNCSCEKYHKLWYYYANMTDYYHNITNLFNQ